MTRAERDKGARGELEVARLLQRRWPNASRTSDGRTQTNRGDITGGPAGVSWEVKRTERLRLRDAWKQAVLAAHGETPVIATRWNAGAWLAILDLNDLLALLAARETAGRYRATLAQIADQESGAWGQIAARALREPAK